MSHDCTLVICLLFKLYTEKDWANKPLINSAGVHEISVSHVTAGVHEISVSHVTMSLSQTLYNT